MKNWIWEFTKKSSRISEWFTRVKLENKELLGERKQERKKELKERRKERKNKEVKVKKEDKEWSCNPIIPINA